MKELHYFNEVHIPGHRSWIRRARLRKLNQFVGSRKSFDASTLPQLQQLAHIACSSRTDEWYSRIFENAPEGAICGDISPGYACLPDVGMDHVRRINSSARILLFVRDPVDRAWSHVRHMLRDVVEPNESEISRILEYRELYDWCDYDRIIRSWQAYFPESLDVYSYDDISDRPGFVLTDIASKLGVDCAFSFQNADKVVFRGKKMEMPPSVSERLLDQLADPMKRFAARKPEIALPWLQKYELSQ